MRLLQLVIMAEPEDGTRSIRRNRATPICDRRNRRAHRLDQRFTSSSLGFPQKSLDQWREAVLSDMLSYA
jgi:hypothetical protein